MMPAAKHGDPQMGVDIHLCIVPPSPSPVPLPTPHMSVVFDPFDYLPIIGATVTVCGMKRAVAGTAGKAVHIPPGFPFAPKIPDTEDELFMGSATVVADGAPFSFLTVPVLACQVAGMPSPPRPKRKGKRLMLLPTVVNMAIPTNVFVGGPPTISMMGMAFKLGFAALGRLAKSRFAKALGQRFSAWRKAKFGHLASGFLKCTILRAEPVNIVTGAVSVEQEDFTLPGLIPVRWNRRYASDSARRGACGTGWECPADARLEHDAESGIVLFHHPEGGIAIFPAMPAQGDDSAAVQELMDGALLSDHGDEYRVRTKEDRIYRFPKALGFDVGGGQQDYPLWQVCDLFGNTLTWQRHPGTGRLLALVEATGRRIELEHGPDGLIRRVSLYVPETTFRHTYVDYEQDTAGDLAEVRDALGQPYRFAYDQHHMVRHTDRNGLSFFYAYDRSGESWRVVRSWGDGGLYAYEFAYLDAVNERRVTDSLGHVSVVKLDERDLPISEVDALGGITTFEYDDSCRTTGVTDQDGHRTEFTYDDRGNLLRLMRADGSAIEVEYDALDKPTSFTDASGQRWSERYNARGLLVEQTSPMGHSWTFEHDGRGGLTAFADPRGARTNLRCDSFGNLVELVDALGHHTRFAYDDLGNLRLQTDPLDRTTRYVYDRKSRLVETHLPSGTMVRCEYDAEDGLTRYDDAGEATHSREYTGLQQVSRARDHSGNEVKCRYDSEERLVAVTNERGEAYRLIHDALGRVVEEIDYWGQRTLHRYTPAGRLCESVDPLGRVLTYATDPLGRILERTLKEPKDDGPSWCETFEYDANGHLLAAENPTVRIERRYDFDGKLVAEKQGEFCNVGNDYDACGNRIRRTMQVSIDGSDFLRVVNYAYDAMDRLVSVAPEGAAPLTFERNAAGQAIAEQLGPALRRETSFAANGEIVARRIRGTAGILLETVYGYDRAGNLIGRRHNGFGAERFGHDPARRLTHHLDQWERLQRYFVRPGDGALTAFAERPGESPQWFREKACEKGLLHFDRSGNLVHQVMDSRELKLRWDALGRLIESRNDRGETTEYAYDALGRRMAKRTGQHWTRFGWDGDVLTCDAQSSGGAVRQWIYGPGLFEPLAMTCGGDPGGSGLRVLYYSNDPNGCPHGLLDGSGQPVWAAAYGAWGEIVEQRAEQVENPLRFQGQYFDRETGFSYNRFRYYDARSAQYISPDPIRLEGGADLYAYCPDPYNFIDPLGLKCEKIVRFMSEAEAEAMKKAGGLVRRPQGNGFSRAAKWISELAKGRDPSKLGKSKNYTHKVVMEVEEGTIAWLNDASRKLNYEKMAGGEADNLKRVFVKSNEAGSYGVGSALLDEFNSKIKKITVSKL
jgi:RHS repeat-associated protein